MVSIGGYQLKKYSKINGRDFEGFTAELYKDNKLIAWLED